MGQKTTTSNRTGPAKAGKRKLYKHGRGPQTPVVHYRHTIGWWRRNRKHLVGNRVEGIEPLCPGCDGVHLVAAGE